MTAAAGDAAHQDQNEAQYYSEEPLTVDRAVLLASAGSDPSWQLFAVLLASTSTPRHPLEAVLPVTGRTFAGPGPVAGRVRSVPVLGQAAPQVACVRARSNCDLESQVEGKR